MPLISRAARIFHFPSLAMLAALLLLAWVLASWTWVFFTPRQQVETHSSAVPLLSKLLAEKVVGFRLFGGAEQATQGEGSEPVAAPSNIVVRGIYAARNGRSGFAAIEMDGRAVSAALGMEFAPGVMLYAVYPDRVEIRHNGRIEVARMLLLPNSAPGGVTPTASSAIPLLRLAVRQLGPNQYGLSRSQLLGILKVADQLALLGRYGSHPRGGAVLEQSPAGGLPEKLGLKVGDVVTRINEKSLAGPGDVTRLYEQLVQSERVNVGFLRAGEKMNIGIQVSP